MALLLSSASLLHSSSSSSRPAIAASLSSRTHGSSLNLQQVSFSCVRIPGLLSVCERRLVIVRASSEIDGKDAATPPEEPKEAVSIENLPLESKMQMKIEQKLRMKMAKKIRLRRKRLVRKRHLRKKGRWPPSKMKKLKNV